jgi:tRNA(Ile)-lysidine synthase
VALDLLQKVITFCQENSLLTQKDRVMVGVSGGPDSLCLLHVMVALSRQLNLPPPIVAHFNHQLRGEDSQADANFVQELADRWQLPIVIKTKNVAGLASQRKQSLEETARQVRYAFLWQAALETGANKIAVGHNADDQVETILMHLLRGAGLIGLRGMTPEINLANLSLYPEDIPVAGNLTKLATPALIRPLLEIWRADIEAYCRENNLSPRQDVSNLDTTYFRNRLRHELLPYLETYNQNIRQVLQRTARVAAADIQILDDQLDKVWPVVVQHESPQRIEFNLQHWLNLPLSLKRSTLRRAIQTLYCHQRDINFDHIEGAIEILQKGQTGTKVTLPRGLLLNIGYQIFTIAPESILPPGPEFKGPGLLKDEIVTVNLPGMTHLPHTNWSLTSNLLSREQLSSHAIKHSSHWEIYLDAGMIGHQTILRSRQPGDRFYPLGMGGRSKKLKEFMIDEKIPANWRDHIPLLVSNGRILWVCGYRPDEQARIQDGTQQIAHFKFERTDSGQA